MKKLASFLILSYLLSTNIFAQGIAIGHRFNLTSELQLNQNTTGQFARAFVPDYFKAPENGKFMLVFHLHSASWAAENQVYKAQANVILFNIHLGALSSPYQNYFQDGNKFKLILDKVITFLKNNNVIANPQIEKLIITSFSAGYAGVREIFKIPAYYEQIDALSLADGLHCNSEPALKQEQMKDFLRFARDARDLKKIMFLTHSEIPTNDYQSTTQTADYLINGIGAQRISVTTVDEIGVQKFACDAGYFHLKAYSGETASDHLNHLYGMNLMLEKIVKQLAQTSIGLKDKINKAGEKFIRLNYSNPFNSITFISNQQNFQPLFSYIPAAYQKF